jgi:hypothetical protein
LISLEIEGEKLNGSRREPYKGCAVAGFLAFKGFLAFDDLGDIGCCRQAMTRRPLTERN